MSFFKEPKRLTDDERSEIIERIREKQRIALEKIKRDAEEHPLFMGWYDEGITEKMIIEEGGDSATITEIGWTAKKALE